MFIALVKYQTEYDFHRSTAHTSKSDLQIGKLKILLHDEVILHEDEKLLATNAFSCVDKQKSAGNLNLSQNLIPL